MTADVARVLPWPAGRPWGAYASLHERRPPVWFDEGLDAWVVIGHALASEVLRGVGWSSDPSLSASMVASAEASGIDPTALDRLLIFTDPPHHTRLRRSVQPPFGSRTIGGLGGRVRAVTEAALAALGPDVDVDLMERVVRPVTLAVLAELLDLPGSLVDVLADDSRALVGVLDVEASTADVAAAAGAFTGLIIELLPLVAERRARPGDDVLSWIAGDESLTLDEVVFAALLLVVAGHETTANLVGTALAHGARPGSADGGWATEVARLHTPVQAVVRVATAPQRVGGVDVGVGDQVVVALGAANRDPSVFDRPDDAIEGRAVEPLSFGLGRHHCLGARLALLELEEIVGAVVDHGPFEIHDVVWNDSRTICGPTELHARWVGPAG